MQMIILGLLLLDWMRSRGMSTKIFQNVGLLSSNSLVLPLPSNVSYLLFYNSIYGEPAASQFYFPDFLLFQLDLHRQSHCNCFITKL